LICCLKALFWRSKLLKNRTKSVDLFTFRAYNGNAVVAGGLGQFAVTMLAAQRSVHHFLQNPCHFAGRIRLPVQVAALKRMQAYSA
jgi:hypothetical protein